MKRLQLIAPFVQGMVTDRPSHQLGPQESAFAQDGFSPNGFFKQRGGWSYDGTTADVASNGQGVYRAKFLLADVTRTITTAANGNVYIHNASASGTQVATGSASMLPRCVYNDELIVCSQDGISGIIRYSGASVVSPASPSTAAFSADKATLTATLGTYAASIGPGFYASVSVSSTDTSPRTWVRVLERISSTVLTLEAIKGTAAAATGFATVNGYGTAMPCVSVYDAGTGSFDNASDEFRGTGVKWITGDWGAVTPASDALLVIRPAGTSAVHHISTVSAETTITLAVTAKTDTNLNYAILRNCPFKDAAAHKMSLWGTGVAQYPNRVYVSPPGWNPSFPPSFTLPYDPTVLPESENVNDFLLAYSDVPSATDSDQNVAILPTPNPLLVLKRNSIYALTGDYYGRSIDMIADGIGCIDIRSAWSYDEGAFFCGENGIFMFGNGTIADLTRGKINREWRSLTRDFDYGTLDYCTLQVVSGHLKVDITTGAGTTQRSLLCDLRDQSWQSRISNANARFAYTSRISGEKEKALWVSNDRQGRVMDFAPALDGSGTAKDDAGTGPRMKAWTTSAIAQSQGIEGLTRLVDLNVHANVYDAGAAGSTSVSLSVVSGGGTSNQADSTKTLTAISSDTVDRIDRHSRRVARRGRFHQLQIDVATTGTDSAATKAEIHQITARVREDRVNA